MYSNFLFNIIDTEHAMQWLRDLALNSSRIERGGALEHEAKLSLPCSVFVEEDTRALEEDMRNQKQMDMFYEPHFITGYLTFLDENDNPSYKDEDGKGNMHWFKIEASSRLHAQSLLNDIFPRPAIINGISGWIISLYENETFCDFEDVNAYFHNIMMWESMIATKEAGPIIQRLTWLSETLMSMQRSMMAGFEAIKKANISLEAADFETFETTITKLLKVMDQRERDALQGLTDEDRLVRDVHSRVQNLQDRIASTKNMIRMNADRTERAKERQQDAIRQIVQCENRGQEYERRLERQMEELNELIKSLEK